MVGTMQGELKPMEYESESEEEDDEEEVDAAGSSGQQGYEETSSLANSHYLANWCINCVLMRVMERRERDNS